jgi:hypothetical protein
MTGTWPISVARGQSCALVMSESRCGLFISPPYSIVVSFTLFHFSFFSFDYGWPVCDKLCL